MPNALSLKPREWPRIVSETNGDCLRNALSAKNADHVLSTATVRTPQKVLWTAVESFTAEMCECESGLLILCSLAAYGTAKTVDLLAKRLLAAHEALWTFAEPVPATLAQAAGRLLERLVYRQDVEGGAREIIIQRLRSLPPSDLFSTPFTMVAAARLLTIDEIFAQQLVLSDEAALTLAGAAAKHSLRAATEECCRVLLDAATAKRSASLHNLLSQFVWSTFANELHRIAPNKAPHSTIFILLAKHGSSTVVNEMCRSIPSWLPLDPDIRKSEIVVDAVATLVQRSTDITACTTLAEHLFSDADQVRACLSSGKAGSLHLLAAIYTNERCMTAVEHHLRASLEGELKAAHALYTRRTKSMALATQQAVQRNICALRSQQPHLHEGRAKRERGL